MPQRARHYDPIGYAGGGNLYAYAGNNPATLTDPAGTNPIAIGAGIGLAVGVGAYWLTHRGNFDGWEAARWGAIGALAGGTLGIGLVAAGATGLIGGAEVATLAGGGSAASVQVQRSSVYASQNGLRLVQRHLRSFGPDKPNEAMFARVQAAFNSGQPLRGADMNFYLHELGEYSLMRRGLSYDAAHEAILVRYGVSRFALYHSAVISQYPKYFADAYRQFWRIAP